MTIERMLVDIAWEDGLPPESFNIQNVSARSLHRVLASASWILHLKWTLEHILVGHDVRRTNGLLTRKKVSTTLRSETSLDPLVGGKDEVEPTAGNVTSVRVARDDHKAMVWCISACLKHVRVLTFRHRWPTSRTLEIPWPKWEGSTDRKWGKWRRSDLNRPQPTSLYSLMGSRSLQQNANDSARCPTDYTSPEVYQNWYWWPTRGTSEASRAPTGRTRCDMLGRVDWENWRYKVPCDFTHDEW